MRYAKGLRILDIPVTENGGILHPLYLKEHSERGKQESDGKILFVGNIDYRPSMTPESIDEYVRILFSKFGDIQSISISSFADTDKDNTRFAHVTFAKKSSLKLLLSTADSEFAEPGKEVARKFGIKVLLQMKTPSELASMFPWMDQDPEALQEEVNEYMAAFEVEEQIAKEDREKRLNTVDEDGFMPAKNRNKRKRVVEERRGNANQRPRKEKKSTELKNFYRFQIRDDKMAQLDTLRKKFEEDKERVAKMKDARKFNPY